MRINNAKYARPGRMRRLGYVLLLLMAVAGVREAAAQNKVGTTAASFLGVATDARGLAMGGAQVANATDLGALYWNPSGIAWQRTNAAQFSNLQWFEDAQLQHASASIQTNAVSLGFSISALDYGQIEVTTIDQPDGTGELFSPLSMAFGVTAARSLTDRFSVGVTAKYIRETIKSVSATGVAMDLGVSYQSSFRNLRIGMAMSNFGTDLRLDGEELRKAIDIAPDQAGNNPRLPARMEVDDWPLPLSFRVGVSMDAFRSEWQRLTVGVDAEHPNNNSETANFGLEYGFREMIYLRGGYRQAFADVVEDGGWTAGFGLHYALNNRISGRFDYVVMDHEYLGRPQMWTLGVTF